MLFSKIYVRSDSETECKTYGVQINGAGPINTHPVNPTTRPPMSK